MMYNDASKMVFRGNMTGPQKGFFFDESSHISRTWQINKKVGDLTGLPQVLESPGF